jgi:signal transduction histidine kinase/FixJ family two-component response regulator
VPKEKILIADDEPDVLTLCKRIVRSEGYEVKGVGNGFDAIRAAEQEHFDLFLTDLMMPGMKGLDAAQGIREFRPDIVCVVMTGFGTMETAVQALKLGFNDFVVKPFKPRDLKGAVNRALERERLRRENERLNALVPLFELNKTLMATVPEGELVQRVLHTAVDELNADLGALMVLGKDRRLHVRADSGFDDGQLTGELGDLVTSVTETLLEGREQVFVAGSNGNLGSQPTIGKVLEGLQVGGLVFSPLLTMDTSVGAILLARTDGASPFSSLDRELLSVFCGQAAVALQNARLFEEIQRAYRDLQELDHMKSEFINIAAHELRTPLAILMGHADLLEEDIQDPDDKRRVQVIVRNALRLRDLINDMLDMRRLQAAEARVHLATFHVEELIAAALLDFRPMAESKGIQICADVPNELAPIRSDRQRILSTLNNLVKNAIEFTPEGGQIGVKVIDHGSELQVSVWDNGIGISAEQFAKIFTPFYQVEASLTREHEGMGLGLSIAKGMVELCGGRIWVESEVGQGSRFTFTIPRGVD